MRCWDQQIVRDGIAAKCRLQAGHLGHHHGVVYKQHWWWNAHGYGIMRKRHPTTNKLLDWATQSSEPPR